MISGIRNPVSRIILGVSTSLFCIGCHTGTLPDPNDVATAGPNTAEVIMRQLEVASDSMDLRKSRREINDIQYRILMTQIARDYISQAKDLTITDENAATWGKVYTTAHDWGDAETALQQAVKAEKTRAKADFRVLGDMVGDTLALASAQAHLGKIHEAVQTARSIFYVPPKAKAPILTGILYDIVPAGVRRGGGIELAQLLQDAIKQHQEALVDPNTDAGRDFLLARPHHIQHAWEEAARIYQASGQFAMAQDALAQARSINVESGIKT